MSTTPEQLAAECEESADAWANEVGTRRRAAAELRRLAAVEAERDRYASESAQHFIRAREWAERAGAMEAERDQLRAEMEALRADVERYRWLRESSANQWTHPIAVSQERAERGMRYMGPLTGEALDAAIDEARKA